MKPKFGPVASNHGNLKKHRYLPWFKERYAVHAEVNGTDGGGRGKNGDGNEDGNRESRPAGTERGREWRKGEAGTSGKGRGAEAKNGDLSVGNVQPYGTACEWEGVD